MSATWTRPYYGISHYDGGVYPRNRWWATLHELTPTSFVVTFWDRESEAPFTDDKDVWFADRDKAKEAARTWFKSGRRPSTTPTTNGKRNTITARGV